MLVGQVIGIVVLVTVDAAEQSEVSGGRVTIDTEVPFVIVAARVDREVIVVVVEIGAPVRGRVTLEALLRVAFIVVGVARRIEVRLVAERAFGRRILELSANMAGEAGGGDMRTGQREGRRAMVEVTIPIIGVVTLQAVMREVFGQMVIGFVVVFFVT